MTILYNGATYNLSGFLNAMTYCFIPLILILLAIILYDLLNEERFNRLCFSLFMLICYLQIALSHLTFN